MTMNIPDEALLALACDAVRDLDFGPESRYARLVQLLWDRLGGAENLEGHRRELELKAQWQHVLYEQDP